MSAPGQTTESVTVFSSGLTPSLPFQLRGIGKPVSQHDSAHCFSYDRSQILLRRVPSPSMRGDYADRSQNVIGRGPAKNIGAAIERLRPFGDVANRHVGNTEDAGFLLYRSAV